MLSNAGLLLLVHSLYTLLGRSFGRQQLSKCAIVLLSLCSLGGLLRTAGDATSIAAAAALTPTSLL